VQKNEREKQTQKLINQSVKSVNRYRKPFLCNFCSTWSYSSCH